jgi:hypothetical protein
VISSGIFDVRRDSRLGIVVKGANAAVVFEDKIARMVRERKLTSPLRLAGRES